LAVGTDVDTGVYKGTRCVYSTSRLPFAHRLVRRKTFAIDLEKHRYEHQ